MHVAAAMVTQKVGELVEGLRNVHGSRAVGEREVLPRMRVVQQQGARFGRDRKRPIAVSARRPRSASQSLSGRSVSGSIEEKSGVSSPKKSTCRWPCSQLVHS